MSVARQYVRQYVRAINRSAQRTRGGPAVSWAPHVGAHELLSKSLPFASWNLDLGELQGEEGDGNGGSGREKRKREQGIRKGSRKYKRRMTPLMLSQFCPCFCLSVRPSVRLTQSWTTSKRFKTQTYGFHTVWCYSGFLLPKFVIVGSTIHSQ